MNEEAMLARGALLDTCSSTVYCNCYCVATAVPPTEIHCFVNRPVLSIVLLVDFLADKYLVSESVRAQQAYAYWRANHHQKTMLMTQITISRSWKGRNQPLTICSDSAW